MKFIAIVGGSKAIVDDADYNNLIQYSWYLDSNGYPSRTTWLKDKKMCRTWGMHNEIMGIRHVDHINHNPLDNRRFNLRKANQQQNSWNRVKTLKKTHSRFKGVTKHQTGKWQVYVSGKYYGLYLDEISAAKKYNEVAQSLFGEFAYINKDLI